MARNNVQRFLKRQKSPLERIENDFWMFIMIHDGITLTIAMSQGENHR